VTGGLRPARACHCSQCTKTHDPAYLWSSNRRYTSLRRLTRKRFCSKHQVFSVVTLCDGTRRAQYIPERECVEVAIGPPWMQGSSTCAGRNRAAATSLDLTRKGEKIEEIKVMRARARISLMIGSDSQPRSPSVSENSRNYAS
jgi:hypothetical protein